MRGHISALPVVLSTERCQCKRSCEFPCWQRVGIAPACGICGCKQQAAYDELHGAKDA